MRNSTATQVGAGYGERRRSCAIDTKYSTCRYCSALQPKALVLEAAQQRLKCLKVLSIKSSDLSCPTAIAIARIPYGNIWPEFHTTASELATMEFVCSLP